ncbi:MAG TPA: ATP-binding protein [Gemmatimonadaceae bacterium]|nr:ATP-binding protein [Gemmatimonadaceae bacterium]
MMDDDILVDRERECNDLRTLLQKPGPSMAVLYGRRRVGKTFLLQHVWPRERTFHFTAADATPELNRRALLDAAARWAHVEVDPRDYPTWRRVFEFLLELGDGMPTAVVLDEYQYLRGDATEQVDSALAAVWERYVNRRPKGPPFVLVLCGSIVRIMERLDAGDNPLYGRLDWKGRLEPFDYYDAARLASFPAARDRALAYGIFGGTPRYLAVVDPARSLATNVIQSMLSTNGNVRIQVETVIAQEHGLRDMSEYHAVLGAIGAGATDRNEIAQQTGLTNTAAFRVRLDKLVDLGLIEATRNFGANEARPYRYRLTDPALRFYYGVVARYRSELDSDTPASVWEEHVVPMVDAYMGLVFERMAVQGYLRFRQHRRLPMVREWGRWEGLDRDRRQVEIDLVARRTDGRMLTGAVKWNARPATIALHTTHVDMLRRLAESGHAWAAEALEPEAILYYLAAGGFKADFRRQAAKQGPRVEAWSLTDLYRSVRPTPVYRS